MLKEKKKFFIIPKKNVMYFNFFLMPDALLANLRAIEIHFDFCSNKCYVNIICASGCLEAVDLIIAGRDHTLHTYATDILHIRYSLHENGNTTLVHVLREQNMCVDFTAKEGSHANVLCSLERLREQKRLEQDRSNTHPPADPDPIQVELESGSGWRWIEKRERERY